MDFLVELRRYRLPFRHPVRTAHGNWDFREGLYIRLERPDGTVGFGEACPVPHFGSETVEADEALVRSLGSRIGGDALAGVPGELCALRNALARAMGGTAPAPLQRSLAVAALLPAGRAALLAAPPLADAGFRVFKWKVAVGAADDERAILDDLAGILPPGSRVRLDANGGWDRRTAQQWMDHAVGRPVEFVEQPVARDSRGCEDSLMGLAADYPVPVALDEDLGWQGIFVIKPSLLGDPRAVLARLLAAEAKVVFSSALETGIGAQSSLREAFSWAGTQHALGFGVWPLFADPQFNGPSAVPMMRFEDVDRINPQELWNAAS
jgi:o-succinylbenzoate synthase